MAKYPFNKVCQDYKDKLATMVIKPEWKQTVHSRVSMIRKNKKRYETVSAQTGVPWEFIALTHLRESGCDFTKHLHNGDPLSKKTRQVPRGRPKGNPPFTFEESAIDALEYQGLTKVKDWSLEHMVYLLEAYNGFGYRMRNKPSPYLWSGTNHYVKGKFVKDGKYNPTYVDKQVGLVPVLVALKQTKAEEKAEYKEAKKEVENTSTKVQTGDYLKKFLTSITSILTGVGLAWHQVWDYAKDYAIYVALGLVVSFVIYLEWNKLRTIRDYIDGRYVPSRKDTTAKQDPNP